MEKYNTYGNPSYTSQSSAQSSQERDGAVSWITGGGVLVTHTRLFVGMECPQVIWVTHYMGGHTLARSNIMRAVARLVVVTKRAFNISIFFQKSMTITRLKSILLISQEQWKVL